jgi:hypothetical protein
MVFSFWIGLWHLFQDYRSIKETDAEKRPAPARRKAGAGRADAATVEVY